MQAGALLQGGMLGVVYGCFAGEKHVPVCKRLLLPKGRGFTWRAWPGAAGASTWAVHMTGHAVYDAVGSITIGCLLGCTAIFLIQQNRSLLIGGAVCSRTALIHLHDIA